MRDALDREEFNWSVTSDRREMKHAAVISGTPVPAFKFEYIQRTEGDDAATAWVPLYQSGSF